MKLTTEFQVNDVTHITMHFLRNQTEDTVDAIPPAQYSFTFLKNKPAEQL